MNSKMGGVTSIPGGVNRLNQNKFKEDDYSTFFEVLEIGDQVC